MTLASVNPELFRVQSEFLIDTHAYRLILGQLSMIYIRSICRSQICDYQTIILNLDGRMLTTKLWIPEELGIAA